MEEGAVEDVRLCIRRGHCDSHDYRRRPSLLLHDGLLIHDRLLVPMMVSRSCRVLSRAVRSLFVPSASPPTRLFDALCPLLLPLCGDEQAEEADG